MTTFYSSDNTPNNISNCNIEQSNVNSLNLSPFLKSSFSLVMFNIGDIHGDENWNKERWKYILNNILSWIPDIVVLHEVTRKSSDFFEQLTDHGYRSYAPYIISASTKQKRENWEVIYSKYPVLYSYYYSLSITHGLSHVRIVDLNSLISPSINIFVATWNPHSPDDLLSLINHTNNYIDSKHSSLMLMSTNGYGSLVTPPRSMFDSWTILGCPDNCSTTLNINKCVFAPSSNLRADHIWVRNIKPYSINPINVEVDCEHIGLHVECVIDPNFGPSNNDSRILNILQSRQIRSSRIIDSNDFTQSDNYQPFKISPRKLFNLNESTNNIKRGKSINDIRTQYIPESDNTNNIQLIRRSKTEKENLSQQLELDNSTTKVKPARNSINVILKSNDTSIDTLSNGIIPNNKFRKEKSCTMM